nr:hypothetical protein [Tanacetum cinerariifolium]
MFIKYFTGLLPPKKSRGKGLQWKQTIDTPEADVDVSEESDSEPARKCTSSKRVIKKKVSIYAYDNIIPEANMSHDPPQKLKGIQMLTPEEQLAANTMEALKASKKSSTSQPYVKGSSEGTGSIPWVPNESTLVFSPLDEGTSTKPWVLDKEKLLLKPKLMRYLIGDQNKRVNTLKKMMMMMMKILNGWALMKRKRRMMTMMTNTCDEQMNDDEDEEMTNAEDADMGNGDEEIINATKADAEKVEEVKDDIKKSKLLPTCSSLSVSSTFTRYPISTRTYCTGFLISKPSVLTSMPKTPSVAPATTLLPPSSISTISNVPLQSTTSIPTPPITTEAPPVTTLPDPLIVISQRVTILEKEVHELNEADNTITLFASLKSKIPSVVNTYLGSSLGDTLRKGKKTKRSITKESKPSRKSSTSKESSKGKSPAKTSKSSKSITVEEPVEELVFEMAFDDIEQTVDDVGKDVNEPPDDSTQTKDKYPKKYWFKQPPWPPTPDQEWNKQGDRCPFDLTKPLPYKGHPGRLIVAVEYFFNNDLEFQKSSDLEKMYTTSITKTKAAKYEIVKIKDMVLMLWSTTKVSVNVKKLHGYGHLEEIVVRKVDRRLYKFKEGDFVDLHLNDIEDMLLLDVQHKLFQLDESDIVDLIVALCMFTRSLIIKRRV